MPRPSGDLGAVPALSWHPGAAVTVVIAAEGYPEAPAKGDVITHQRSPRRAHRATSCTRAPLLAALTW